MSDEEFDDTDEPDLEDVLDDDLDDSDDLLVADDVDGGDIVDIDDLEVDPDVLAVAAVDTPIAVLVEEAVTPTDEDDDDDDIVEIEEELHPDDVEVPLDTILQERIASSGLDDDEEDEELESDDRGESPTKIVPRRAGEFLCSSCFLVLPRNQLGDESRSLCRDCV